MTPAHEWLADLVRRVPVLVIDTASARRSSDTAALAYVRAIREWQDEAALALAEATQDSRSDTVEHIEPDAYARAALASALTARMHRESADAA